MSLAIHQSQNTNIITLTAYLYDYTSNPGPIGIKHFHKNYELLIPTKGTSEVYINDVKYVLKPNCALIIHPFQTHHIQVLGEESLLWCSTFSANLVSSFTSPLEGKIQQSPLFYPSKQCIEYFLSQMQLNFGTFRIWGKLSKEQILVAKSCFYGIGSEYLKQVNLKKMNMAKTRENLIIKISDFMSENFKKNVTLQDLAFSIGYNYQYLSKNFTNLFNENFKSLLNRYRMDYAYTQLTETTIPITQIAFDSGFQSQRTFNYVCKEFFNLSPSNIRDFNK